MNRSSLTILSVLICIILFQAFSLWGQEEHKEINRAAKFIDRLVSFHGQFNSSYIGAIEELIKGSRFKDIKKILNINIIKPSLSYEDFFKLETGSATTSNRIKKFVVYVVVLGVLIIPFLLIPILIKKEENKPHRSAESIPDVKSNFDAQQIKTERMKGKPSEIN